jgi:hypothetical protein
LHCAARFGGANQRYVTNSTANDQSHYVVFIAAYSTQRLSIRQLSPRPWAWSSVSPPLTR